MRDKALISNIQERGRRELDPQMERGSMLSATVLASKTANMVGTEYVKVPAPRKAL